MRKKRGGAVSAAAFVHRCKLNLLKLKRKNAAPAPGLTGNQIQPSQTS
jgi:hypothetical protein